MAIITAETSPSVRSAFEVTRVHDALCERGSPGPLFPRSAKDNSGVVPDARLETSAPSEASENRPDLWLDMHSNYDIENPSGHREATRADLPDESGVETGNLHRSR
jgi:hypothetical protein